MSKCIVPTLKPRNPVALPASRRKAGAHRRSPGAERAAQRQALRREVAPWPSQSP